MRGPAPKGIDTRLAELAPPGWLSQRSGSNACAFGKCFSLTLSLRITHHTPMPLGTRMPLISVSRSASMTWNGATGFRRMVSCAQASR